MSAKFIKDRTEEGFAQDLFDRQRAYLAATLTKILSMERRPGRFD
jgi:hypothetical protein